MFRFVECRHIMTNGRKCHAAALRGKPFCFHHAKLHFRNSAPRFPQPAPLDLDSIPGLEAAVGKALTALTSPLADTRRAGLLLFGLNVAATLSKRSSPSDLSEPAKPDH
jgi:hypothetical protein